MAGRQTDRQPGDYGQAHHPAPRRHQPCGPIRNLNLPDRRRSPQHPFAQAQLTIPVDIIIEEADNTNMTTLSLPLTREQENRLRQEAKAVGLTATDYALRRLFAEEEPLGL